MDHKAKAREQSLALNNWINNGRQGTIVACTGFGKTKLAVDAINLLSFAAKDKIRVKIVVPTTNLRDQEWKTEIEKWSNLSTKNKAVIDVECQQTVYNLRSRTYYDLLIIDEVHEALSPQYRKVFQVNHKHLLCLTATLPTAKEEYMQFLDSLAPVCYEITVKEAREKGIISDFEVYNIATSMNTKEKWLYNKFNAMFLEGKAEIETIGKRHNKFYQKINAFDLAGKYSKIKDTSPLLNHEIEMVEASKKFWSGMSMRRKILNTTEEKISTAVKLIQEDKSVSKWIVFSLYTTQADEIYDKLTKSGISCIKYHSKMSEKEKKEELEKLKTQDIKVICSAEALQTGFNLPELDGAIALSFNSDKISMVQSLGRAVRFREDKQAKYFNLYNKNTQEEKWLEKRLEGITYKSTTLFNYLY